MDRLYTSTEILSWENNDVAIENAIEVLKARLDAVPATVLNDVLDRCDPDTHHGLIDWISTQTGALQQQPAAVETDGYVRTLTFISIERVSEFKQGDENQVQ